MKNKKVVILAVALVAAIAILATVYFVTRPATEEGKKHITVVISDGVQAERGVEFDTEAEYLGPALLEQELVEGDAGQYGLYITAVEGVVADESQQQWWCITKGGETVMTGVDETPIADGECFEITLMTGYGEWDEDADAG